jgi:hypothetical protein
MSLFRHCQRVFSNTKNASKVKIAGHGKRLEKDSRETDMVAGTNESLI